MNLALIQSQPLPSAMDAETALLGAVLYENNTLKRLDQTVTPEAFSEPYHQRLWAVILDMVDKGRLAEPTSIAERLTADDLFKTFGGLRYLSDLVMNAGPPSTAPDYARRVNDAAQRRAIIQIATDAAQSARDPEQEPFTVISEADAAMAGLMVASAPDGHTLIDAREAAADLVAELDHEAATGVSPGLLIGIDCIDRGLGGLFPNEMIVLGGRPSMGKTSLARAIAFATARKHPDVLVAFFALEMDRRQLSRRNLSALSFETGRGIPYRDMKRGRDLSAEDRALLSDMGRRVPANLILDDTAVLSIDHITRRCLSLSKRGKLVLVVIDYLQIMEFALHGGMNMTTAIGVVTRRLKQLAKQLSCCFILLSQLSRKVEERDHKRPVLSDLRESGSIEQDASSVLFAYRDAYYLEREGPRRGESQEEHDLKLHGSARTMEVICAKSREGPIGTIKQTYYAECDVIQNEERYP